MDLYPSQVRPYHFDFICNVKKRWEGMNIIEVFSEVRQCTLYRSCASYDLGHL